jgi:hypothetical protein
MKRFIILFALNIVLVLIQNSFLGELFGFSYSPNLVLALAYSLFFMDLNDLSLMSGFIGGLLLDLFGFSIVGLSALTITGTLVLFTYVKRYLFRGWTSNLVLVFLAQIVYINMLIGAGSLPRPVIISGLSTLVFSLGFYLLVQSFAGYLGKPGHEYSK